ncbi:MAG: type I glyceraldehyde-3-phosphate dehydrogenase [candidate division WOR-3 bacterium]|nr:type I glyceraldehyde-3-phosphate dehydrogenase [candidate division WOR-3 bacterium]
MAVKVAINGFGRIGRLVLRAGLNNKNFDIVAVNDITDAKTLAHLFKYDSVHRTFNGTVVAKADSFLVNDKEIKAFSEKDPSKLPWKDLGIEIVVESSGAFTSYEKSKAHLDAGAKKVIITAPPKGETPVKSIVMGVNEQIYDPKTDQIISNASCTTNCVVPIAKVLHENFKIQRGYMTTIHAYTNDQNILDAPHKDLRRARAGAMSMIPTSTGAAKLIGVVFPELKGKIDGTAIRVPTADVSLVDLSCVVEKETTKEEVNMAFEKACNGPMKKYIQYLTEPLVSIDFTGSPYSAIFDSTLTAVIDKNLVKLFAWYDNEWGYTCRVIDLIEYIISHK